MGDVAIALRAARRAGSVDVPAVDPIDAKRRMLAEFCRLIGELQAPTKGQTVIKSTFTTSPQLELVNALPPRLRQTLAALLRGDSEKQVARTLQLSPHTIHVYVKSLYRRFNVASRGELLAKWVAPSSVISESGAHAN